MEMKVWERKNDIIEGVILLVLFMGGVMMAMLMGRPTNYSKLLVMFYSIIGILSLSEIFGSKKGILVVLAAAVALIFITCFSVNIIRGRELFVFGTRALCKAACLTGAAGFLIASLYTFFLMKNGRSRALD